MEKFNVSDFRDFQVTERSKVPSIPHYQAIVFGSRTEITRGYDRYEADTSMEVPNILLYVFMKKQDLDMFVEYAMVRGTKFVFYHVASLGQAKINVSVAIDEKRS